MKSFLIIILFFWQESLMAKDLYYDCGLSMAKMEDQASRHLFPPDPRINDNGAHQAAFSYRDLVTFSVHPETKVAVEYIELPLYTFGLGTPDRVYGRELFCPSLEKTIKAFRHQSAEEALCISGGIFPKLETSLWLPMSLSECEAIGNLKTGGSRAIEPSRMVKLELNKGYLEILGRYGLIYRENIKGLYQKGKNFSRAITIDRNEKQNPYNFSATLHLGCRLTDHTNTHFLMQFMYLANDSTPGLPKRIEHDHSIKGFIYPSNACHETEEF